MVFSTNEACSIMNGTHPISVKYAMVRYKVDDIIESFHRRKRYYQCDDIVTFDRDQRDQAYTDVYRKHEKCRSSSQYELIHTPYNSMASSGLCNNILYPNLMEIIRRGGTIAGSFPLYLLIGTEFDDIDIFVTSKEAFFAIRDYIESFRCSISTFKHSIKFKIRNIKFNLIARIYQCQEEIIYGFDLPTSQIMFDGKSLVYTPLLDYCISKKYMEVDGNRLSPTYFQRLYKYWKRGVIKTIYFPEYEIIRERLIELPIFHQAWYLKDIPSRVEGFVKDDESSSDYGSYVNRFYHRYNSKAFKYRDLVFVLYEVADVTSTNENFELSFIESDPGAQINSTIFPTPINGASEWKRWIDKELKALHSSEDDYSPSSDDEYYDETSSDDESSSDISLEEIESSDAYDAYVEAKCFGTSPELEDRIATDAKVAYEYAKDVIKGRWPEGEPIISTDAHTAYKYEMVLSEEAIIAN